MKLDVLKGVKNLVYLNLEQTKVSDEGLKKLKHLDDLKWLDLSSATVTDRGLAEPHELEKLLSVNLRYSEPLTDEGFKNLTAVKSLTAVKMLTAVDLQFVKVSAAGFG